MVPPHPHPWHQCQSSLPGEENMENNGLLSIVCDFSEKNLKNSTKMIIGIKKIEQIRTGPKRCICVHIYIYIY